MSSIQLAGRAAASLTRCACRRMTAEAASARASFIPARLSDGRSQDVRSAHTGHAEVPAGERLDVGDRRLRRERLGLGEARGDKRDERVLSPERTVAAAAE